MPHPIIIIELSKNKFEALYSNFELSFILVNRKDDNNDDVTIAGPYTPTVATHDLSKVIDGITILHDVLDRRGEEPFSSKEETLKRGAS